MATKTKTLKTNKLLTTTASALSKSGFETFVARDRNHARDIFFSIVDREKPASISWGGSATAEQTGIIPALKAQNAIPVIVTSGEELSREEKIENRRRALLCDLFVTGTNAVTADGRLVNLDGIGNRVAALAFGPPHVVVVVGKNKITSTLEEALDRVKNHAALMNIKRFPHLSTPCLKTGRCHDCNSPDRICNVWTVTEKSRPEGRIKIILTDEDLGF